MELRNLRHFSALAESLNYRIAAERLHLTQPALTRSIVALERELGVRLFDRDKRRVSLTTDGVVLLERAREVLAQADRLSATAGAMRARQRHEVRIAVYGVGLAELTHPVIEAFCERYPNALIRVHDADFHRGMAPLLSGEYDVALAYINADIPAVTRVPIFSEPVSVALWKGHPLASAAVVDVTELAGDPWVVPDAWDDFWVCADRLGDPARRVGSHARSSEEMRSAIAYQHMTGLMPSSCARIFPHPAVIGVQPKEPIHSVVGIAYPKSGHSPAASAFTEVARRIARREFAVPDAVPVV